MASLLLAGNINESDGALPTVRKAVFAVFCKRGMQEHALSRFGCESCDCAWGDRGLDKKAL